MAFKNLTAFGAGELTPELWERGELEKFRTGLAVLRNAHVTKTGGLRSRVGTQFFTRTKGDKTAKITYIREIDSIIELTDGNLRVYRNVDELFDFTTTPSFDDLDMALYPTMDDVEGIRFVYSNKFLFIFREGFEALRVDLTLMAISPGLSGTITPLSSLTPPNNPWWVPGPNNPSAITHSAGSPVPTGYDVDYIFTYVYAGVETFPFGLTTGLKKPKDVGQFNILNVTLDLGSFLPGSALPEEVRFYQRPADGGSFHYVGRATAQPVGSPATLLQYYFKDAGVEISPTDQPPEFVRDFIIDSEVNIGFGNMYPINAKVGYIYQNRLIFSGSRDTSKVFGTRTGSTAMTRDFPLQDDSAVSFKIGSDGGLKIKAFMDARGLLVFTTVGIYETPTEVLTPETAYVVKRGNYVATGEVDPLQLGNHTVFFEERINAVYTMSPSGNDMGYSFFEVSIYSNHLFKNRQVVSWAVQSSDTQILWIVLDNGQVVSFSYQEEQQLRSWSRADFKYGKVEEVFTVNRPDESETVAFVINRDGKRCIETLSPLNLGFKEYIGTDSSIFYNKRPMTESVVVDATVAPVTPDEWDGPLTITPNGGGFGTVPGKVLRVYEDEFRYIELEVTDNTMGVLTVQPRGEFPQELANLHIYENPLYEVLTTLTGLDHLEGQKVSVRVDGFTHASPLNTDKELNEYIVTSGQIELAPEDAGCFISVGLPIVTDIKTLEVHTVEQQPIKIGSQIVNSLWLSYYNSRFLYAGSFLPEDDTITGMDIQEFEVEEDYEIGITETIPPLPMTRRTEIQIQGDWRENGSVSFRNVDPQPIGLLAIIPDIEPYRGR